MLLLCVFHEPELTPINCAKTMGNKYIKFPKKYGHRAFIYILKVLDMTFLSALPTYTEHKTKRKKASTIILYGSDAIILF
jgi:hypothetical protein